MKKFRVTLKIIDIKVYFVEAENKEEAESECINNESLIPVMEYPAETEASSEEISR